MAGSLYSRVSARGFTSGVIAGATGAGAQDAQGGGQDLSSHGQQDWGPPSSTLPQFQPEAPPAPGVLIVEGAFGLPGTLLDPDQTPGYGPGTLRTHAAPFPGWAGSYADAAAITALHGNSRQIHGEDFGALARHTQAPPDGGTELPMNPWAVNSPGGSNLQQLDGQIRAMGGYDAQQGYGGGGAGPGGINAHGFGSGHRQRLDITGEVVNAYLDPGERPLIVPQASGSFTPSDAVQGPGPQYTYLGGDSLAYNAPTTYQPPPDPATLPGPLPGAPASAGWW